MESLKLNTKKVVFGALFVFLLAIVWVLIWANSDNKKEQLKIDETPTVVAEIKKISEFTCACYYEDLVLKDSKENKTVPSQVVKFVSNKKTIIKDQLVIVANGKVRAGFKLSKLQEKDVVVKDSVLEITLPKAEILDVIINPTGFDIYIEDGKWSHDQIVKVENKAKETIKKKAIKEGILDKATKVGVERLKELFKTFGYKDVVIKIKE